MIHGSSSSITYRHVLSALCGIQGRTIWSLLLVMVLCSLVTEAVISKINYKKADVGKEKIAKEKTSSTKEFNANPNDSTTDELNKNFKSDTTKLDEETSSLDPSTQKTTTPSMEKSSTLKSSYNKVPEILPCTCGIFLSSQFTKGSTEPPRGECVISNALERTFPCNGVGQKQCQTKCLEQIVQHLPNSANILCAALDHDIHKERAYLFIKNCEDKWINTHLAAGREYCCKNREPCSCK
ncbi:follicle cell protein 3C-1 isoform X1 [Stomoxys calcitrans]|uniref:follicle cell protein 3C-1 isoform X1 n=1 Tax=Stomoxys calcitrans TaxID=35570 RepID=UPI0027E29528|nr:follicle cell protein 3C-1 isoform X1 [Stomoxys calcitrans]